MEVICQLCPNRMKALVNECDDENCVVLSSINEAIGEEYRSDLIAWIKRCFDPNMDSERYLMMWTEIQFIPIYTSSIREPR